ncbi:uncharacterized protein LOC131019639 [Salvia miltiorrhiza]|uniref:uncharacterized protein LOC131019639 n=1 Tax=Salvia miltiorrhiza TaxID=226208 RepID=UPI0025ACE72A|nr:uncharacterized protein LOC131019639 [Salvia miltiorrhiza]
MVQQQQQSYGIMQSKKRAQVTGVCLFQRAHPHTLTDRLQRTSHARHAGWPDFAPYNTIHIGAATPEIPPSAYRTTETRWQIGDPCWERIRGTESCGQERRWHVQYPERDGCLLHASATAALGVLTLRACRVYIYDN